MSQRAPVFAKIINDYLAQIAGIDDRGHVCSALGISAGDDGYRIPFFQRTYTVGPDRIVDEKGKILNHTVSVILCKYLLLCPRQPSNDCSLATYKDFKDAAPYVGGFRNTVEVPIARYFENNLQELERRCRYLGGETFDTEVSCQLAMKFQALPKVPVILLFNDADEEFPAQAMLLLQKNASSYLDMECLAMVGGVVAHRLQDKQ